MPLYDAPKRYAVNLSKDRKVLQFRHPWVDSIVRFSVVKLPDIEKEEARVAGIRLMEIAPKTQAEMPSGTPEKLAEQYLRHIEDADNVESEIEIDEKGNVIGSDASTIVQDKLALMIANRDKQKAIRQRDAALAQVDNLLRASGERSAEERRATLRGCLEHWSQHLKIRRGSKQPKSERKSVIHRATKVLEAIGLDKRYGAQTLATVQAGLDG